MYLSCNFNNRTVSALCDSGSSINLMSYKLYSSLPKQCKSHLISINHGTIALANNQTIDIDGISTIACTIRGKQYDFDVYILQETSHPLILGVEFFKTNDVVLNFSNSSVTLDAKIMSMERISLPPYSESIVYGKVESNCKEGYVGICCNSSHIVKKKVLAARTLVTVPQNHKVPMKLLNPSSQTVVIHKNKPIGSFEVIHQSKDLLCKGSLDNTNVNMQSADIPMCNNVKVNSESLNQQSRGMPNHNRNTDKDLLLANFDLKIDNLSNQEKSELENCLFENKDIFVTKENPSLGLTTLVEHQIHLKPDAKSKHQRPYKLPPDKREVLRHQLNELLKQGIITPVSEREDVPITSPIVLISKRRKVKVGVKPGSKEESLSMYRFVVDFRFLNTQTHDFRYAITDVQELIESFTHITPNYMSSIDLHSGFFQMKIAQESTKYTAFNTCFGTHKFQRLPQGMKSSPNSFQLLMDKVLNGLSFKTTLCYMDDVIVVSETFSQHMKDLTEVFDRISNAGLKLLPSKCQFAQNRCVFLGHGISKEGIRPPPDRINAIKDFTEPKTAK